MLLLMHYNPFNSKLVQIRSRVGPELVQSWPIVGPKEGVGEVEGERGGEVLLAMREWIRVIWI